MPDNSQNFNRYSYALNNPLKYTDPSGYNIQPHPRYDSWEKNITGAGRGFMRAFNQYGYMSSDQLGAPQLAYGYDWSTGTYRNNEGSVVSWYDVKDNMFNSNSSHDTYALFQTAFRNENNQWVGTGNFGVIKEGLYKSTGLYPTFTVYSNALNFASGMESGFGGSEGDGWHDGASISISGAYASPLKLTGSRGFSLGYYQGSKNGGFYFTAKKGKGVMLSLSLDGNYFVNTENDFLKFDELLGKGESWDIGFADIGGSFSAGNSINGTPYYCVTGSYSPGLDWGAAEWNTHTVPLIINGSMSPINTILNFIMIDTAYKNIKE
jgi:hypothetical protein